MHNNGKLRVSLMLAAVCVCAFGQRDAEAADKVTFVTDFGYNGRHAYYFVALEKGYYARQNLDVQIVRGQGSADAVKQVAAGTTQKRAIEIVSGAYTLKFAVSPEDIYAPGFVTN